MQITIKGKNMEVGESLRTYVTEVLEDITAKYFSNPLEAHVVFSQERHLITVDISVHVTHNLLLQVSAESSEARPAFDLASEKMASRLHRNKQRIKNHHKATHEATAASSFILESSEEASGEKAEPVVIAEMETEIHTLTVSDAVMHLELGELPALMFRNSAHGGLNMVYRRADGNIGWVDPAGNKKS